MRRASSSMLTTLLVAALLSGCGAATSSESESLAPELGTARVESTATATFGSPGGPKAVWSGSGVTDYAAGRTDVTVVLTDGEHDPVKTRTISLGDTAFVLNPGAVDVLPEGKRWVRYEIDRITPAIARAIASSHVASFVHDPRDALERLARVGIEVVELGQAIARDVETTHYRAEFDSYAAIRTELRQAGWKPNDIEHAFKDEPPNETVLELWIDDNGLVRKYSRRTRYLEHDRADDPEDVGFTHEEVVELFDFGVTVEIETPPLQEVVDSAELKPHEQAKVGVSVRVAPNDG